MEKKWTIAQQSVMESPSKNLLVSAAAGSGKTAVLVERIVQMITREENPVNVDEILVVTFTKAASQEMRERIFDALEQKRQNAEDNPELQNRLTRQLSYIYNAAICTIDSFCLDIIREYFQEIELNPGFRIADEGEMKLLQADVMEEVLEAAYVKREKGFLELVDAYSGKNDKPLENYILELFRFSMSNPWPEKWLKNLLISYEVEEKEELEKLPWMKNVENYVETVINNAIEILNQALMIAKEKGNEKYLERLMEDMDYLKRLKMAKTYESKKVEIGKIIEYYKGVRMPSISKKAGNVFAQEQIKNLRNHVRDTIRSVEAKFFYQDELQILQDIQSCQQHLKVFVELTIDFIRVLAEKKREKNILDFSDMEHLALEILMAEDDGKMHPTRIAQEISEKYQEIMIDEYQDSNLVQEAILTSISKENIGMPNIIMVGDVKQSIYRFRLARPELFIEKYDTYPTEREGKYQRISLDKNFRSKENIIQSINFIFEQIMGRDLGNVEYDKESALYLGADYPKSPNAKESTELILLEDVKADKREYDKEDLALELENAEQEAYYIAKRIQELTDEKNGYYVWDNTLSRYRIAQYKDITILMRGLKNWQETMEEILTAQGIPSWCESKEGYFSAMEVQTLLSLLQIIDNPRQDIPMAAVLGSPIAGFSSEDLAKLHIFAPDAILWDALLLYIEETADKNSGIEQELWKKSKKFYDKLSFYRKEAIYRNIPDLIAFLLEDTGYYRYVTAMPAGRKRAANLDMLLEKAVSYEAGSYRGLFQFVRYIEKLKKYRIDYGEASLVGEEDNSVKIVSIHKSKGLEYPIVFLAGMNRKFNQMDSRQKLLIDADLGVGMDYYNAKTRIKAETMMRKAVANKLTMETLGEELRLLYVAMTRAKEKVIMVASGVNLDKKLNTWLASKYIETTKLPFNVLVQANSYLDWVGAAMARNRVFNPFYQEREAVNNMSNRYYDYPVQFEVEVYPIVKTIEQEVQDQWRRKKDKEVLLHWNTEYVYDEAMQQHIREIVDYQYPYWKSQDIRTKMSVSELKKLSHLPDEETAAIFPSFEREEELPVFLQQKKPLTGAKRGTAYHRIMELLDFTKELTREEIQFEIETMKEEQKISREVQETVDINTIYEMTQSELGERMKRAAKEGKLWKERQFVMGMEANQIHPDYSEDEMVVVQGIIDVYFEEGGELVVADYKTDRVQKMEELKERYQTQLEYYTAALERITQKPVKEKIIYSFALEQEMKL